MFVVPAPLASCGPPSINHRFQQDTGCLATSVTAERMSNGLWEVRGCGARQRYVCTQGGTCVRDEPTAGALAARKEPAPAPRPEAPDLPLGIHRGQGRDGRRGVRLVMRDEQTVLVLQGVPADDPDVVTVTAYSRDGVPLAECGEYAIQSRQGNVGIPGGRVEVATLAENVEGAFVFRFCDRTVDILETQRLQVSDFLRIFREIAEDPVDETAAAASASDPAGTDPTPSDPGSDEDSTPARAMGPGPEATIRAAIDATRRSINACLGGAGAIQARWSASGDVTLSASGQPADAPAQGCVRAAVGALRVSARAAGQLLHAVE